jgi:hypothetical protein
MRYGVRAMLLAIALLALPAVASAHDGRGHDDGSHSLRAPLTGESFYFVMADRFENGSTANDQGGLRADRLVSGFDPTAQGLLPRRRPGRHPRAAALHQGSRHDLDLADAELQEQGRAARGRSVGRLPRLLDHGLHADRPAPRQQRRACRADPRGARHGDEGLLRHHHQSHRDVIDYEEGHRPAYVSKDREPYRTASGTPFDDRDFAGTNDFPPLSRT